MGWNLGRPMLATRRVIPTTTRPSRERKKTEPLQALAVPPPQPGGATAEPRRCRMHHRQLPEVPPLILPNAPAPSEMAVPPQGPAVPPPHPDATHPSQRCHRRRPAVPPPSPAALKTRASGATASRQRCHRQLGKSRQLNAAVPPLRQRCHRQLAVCAQIGFDAPEYSLSYPFDYISYL